MYFPSVVWCRNLGYLTTFIGKKSAIWGSTEPTKLASVFGILILKSDKQMRGQANARTSASGQQHRSLVVLGSSVSEQFDYIFGNNVDYHPFWASGWTARSLRGPKSNTYLQHIMAPVSRDANVFLSFGSMDVNFAAQRIANGRGYYDFNTFVKEIAESIVGARNTLVDMGFDHVRAVFVAPIIDLPNTYWKGHSMESQLPLSMRAAMNSDIADLVGRKIPTTNLLDRMVISAEKPYAKPQFVRSELEHHVDYIASQDVVWRGIQSITGMLPRRKTRLEVIYPHATHWIKDLRKDGITRPKTCV